MISRTTERFRKAFLSLPEHVKRQARDAYHVFATDPTHASLNFKKIHAGRSVYSIRIGIRYRALGVRDAGTIVWFWIGSHSDYDKLLARL